MKPFIVLVLSLGLAMLPHASYADGAESPHYAKEISPQEMNQLLDCASAQGRDIEVHTVPKEQVDSSVSTHYWGNFRFGSGFSSSKGEGALVLFAIIGLVVVIAVIPYAISYLANLASGDKVCYFHEFAVNGLQLQGEKRLVTGQILKSRRNLSSLTYTVHVDRGNSTDLGLSFELGYHSFQDSGSVNILEEDSYAMFGPRLYFSRSRPSNTYGFLEILGGSSASDRVGTMGKAQIGFRTHPLSSGTLGFGISLGSLYVDMEAGEGFIDTAEKFDMFLSFSLSMLLD